MTFGVPLGFLFFIKIFKYLVCFVFIWNMDILKKGIRARAKRKKTKSTRIKKAGSIGQRRRRVNLL